MTGSADSVAEPAIRTTEESLSRLRSFGVAGWAASGELSTRVAATKNRAPAGHGDRILGSRLELAYPGVSLTAVKRGPR